MTDEKKINDPSITETNIEVMQHDHENPNHSWIDMLSSATYIVYLFWVLITVIILAGVMYFISGLHSNNQTPTFDYLAFVLPCSAGIIAGLGVHAEDDARVLYGISCMLLTVGLLCYLRAHNGSAIALGCFLILLLATLAGFFVQMAFVNWRKNPRSTESNITLIIAILFLVLAVMVGGWIFVLAILS